MALCGLYELERLRPGSPRIHCFHFERNTMIIAQIGHQTTQAVTETGIGLGSAIAVVCSWHRNRSILWAILAGIFSWFYVIYFAMTRRADETK